MFSSDQGFSSFAVDDIDAAKAFYSDVLGLTVTPMDDMGAMSIALPGGARVFVYGKPDHEPAVFTVLNFAVADVDAAVTELNTRGVVTKIYSGPDYGTDDRGIAREFQGGPAMAWFRDPSGNVIAVGEMGDEMDAVG